MLINHLLISVAFIILEEDNAGKIIEFSKDGVSILVHPGPELVVLSETDILVVEAPVIVVILDHADSAGVSISPVKVNIVDSSDSGILNRC